MNKPGFLQFALALLGSSFLLSVSAQTSVSPPKSSQTFSPYTPAQIEQLNQQPLSPAEGPFGPVNPGAHRQKKPPFDSQYFSQPLGEQEAEALETHSAEPYDPEAVTMKF